MDQPHQMAIGHSFSMLQIVCCAVVVLAVLIIIRAVVENLVRSPLRPIPGPWYAKVSHVWPLAIEATGERHFYLDALHKRYGPVVRIGPKEVSFASADATRDIYVSVSVSVAAAAAAASDAEAATAARQHQDNQRKQQPQEHHSAFAGKTESVSGGEVSAGTRRDTTATTTVVKMFPKAPIYDITRSSIGFTSDEAVHRERLRHVGPLFMSAALMPAVEPVLRTKSATLLSELEKRRGAPVDMLYWFRMFSLDAMGEIFVGKSFDALTSTSPPKFTHYMDTAVHAWYLKAQMPRTFAFLRRLPYTNKTLKNFLDSGDGVYEFAEQVLNEYVARHGRSSASGVPLARLVAGNPDKGLAPLPDHIIANEIMSLLFAGTDTTATTLTYLFYELALHPAWYARLRAEVCAAIAPSAAAAEPSKPNGVAGGPASDTPRNGESSSSSAQASPQTPASSAHNWPTDDEEEHNMPRTTTATATAATTTPPPLDNLTYARLKALPVLNAVLWETMRLHPAAISSLRRQVPHGGAPVAGTRGAWLPAGTVVSTATLTLQRDAAAFPQPDAWAPARWLAAAAACGPSTPLFPPPPSASTSMTLKASAPPHANDDDADAADDGNDDLAARQGTEAAEAQAADDPPRFGVPLTIYEDDAMRAHMNAFSRGRHACLGKTLALVELKLATAALAQRFAAVRLADARQTVEDMRMTDAFALTPKGRKCMLVFD